MKCLQPKLSLLMVLLAFFLLNTVTVSQEIRFDYAEYTNARGETLKYRQVIPDDSPLQRYPLVVFLHGSGERGEDNRAQLKWGVMNFATPENMKRYPAIIIAPQCPENMTWASFAENPEELNLNPSPTKPMELLLELIQDRIENLPVDTSRIYITGLSMGGFGTFDAIMREPKLFAAAVPVCGGGDLSKASTIAHIPIWIFTGAEDSIVNPEFSHGMAKALIDAGAHPGYTQFPEVGHFSWIAAI